MPRPPYRLGKFQSKHVHSLPGVKRLRSSSRVTGEKKLYTYVDENEEGEMPGGSHGIKYTDFRSVQGRRNEDKNPHMHPLVVFRQQMCLQLLKLSSGARGILDSFVR